MFFVQISFKLQFFFSRKLFKKFVLIRSNAKQNVDEQYPDVDEEFSYGFMQFDAKKIEIVLRELHQNRTTFAIYDVEVYTSANLALRYDSVEGTTKYWQHGVEELLDGDPHTFWLSEPLSTSAEVSVDLLYSDFEIRIQQINGHLRGGGQRLGEPESVRIAVEQFLDAMLPVFGCAFNAVIAKRKIGRRVDLNVINRESCSVLVQFSQHNLDLFGIKLHEPI